MFRIEENENGSTYVYCITTGKLICTVPQNKNSSCPRKVNVVGPQRISVPIYSTSLNVNSSSKREESTSFVDDDSCEETQNSPKQPEINEDYHDDCITQTQFARCLDLVPSDKFAITPRSQLLDEFPLRLLSRSKAFRNVEGNDFQLSDTTPITSFLGTNILKTNECKNFIKDCNIHPLVKKYDLYCRQPFNSSQPNGYQFPKLRCREKKQYPVFTSTKVLKQEYNHSYTYGRRQRAERIKVLNTGLCKRSRKLLRFCRRKTCEVKMTKLPPEEINDWLSRRSDFSGDPNENLKPTYSLDDLPNLKKCRVQLTDVLRNIQKRPSGYYVHRTSILVPFFIQTKRSCVRDISDKNTKNRKHLFDHRSSSGTPVRLKLKNTRIESLPVEVKTIPIIDLTQEASSPSVDSKNCTIVSQWLFRCFACGYMRYFYNAGYKTEVRHHMMSYHSVSDPDKFLTRYLDAVNETTIIEAFPGYKNMST